MKPYQVLYIVLLLFISSSGFAQQKGTGYIIDAQNKAPIAGATIYINNTQFSTISNAKGVFQFPYTAGASATIVVSHTGYEKTVVDLDGKSGNLLIEMPVLSKSLNEVVVQSTNKNTWKKWGELFTQYFIGTTTAADKSKIINPEVIRFRYNEKQQRLTVIAKESIKITNNWLGYTVYFDLDSFMISFTDNLILYEGTSYYENLKGSHSDSVLWSSRRLAAYLGSEMHFFRSLYRDSTTLANQGFRIFSFKATPNREKERIEQMILKWQAEEYANGKGRSAVNLSLLTGNKDSARYYKSVLAQGTFSFKDSVPLNISERIIHHKDHKLLLFKNDTFLVQFNSKLALPKGISKHQSININSVKSASNSFFTNTKTSGVEYSLLQMREDDLLGFYENGFHDPSNLLVTGFMAEKKVADALPWDYDPEMDLRVIKYGYEPETILAKGSLVDKESKEEQMENTFDSISNRYSSTRLFLHLDKTIYNFNENIWFAGYVLGSPFDLSQHHTLYVSLFNKKTKALIASEQFVMHNGKGAGYIFLSDSLSAGDYQLLSYTNTFGMEAYAPAFQQEISIHQNNEPYTFRLSKGIIKGDSIVIRGIIKDQNNKFPIGAQVFYKLKSRKEIMASGETYVKLNGEIELPIVSRSQFKNKPLLLTADIKKDKQPFTIHVEIPLQQDSVKVNWFPESGGLVDGLPTRLAYEVINTKGEALLLKGKLLEDGVIITNIETNSAGTGIVGFTPHAGKKYSVIWEKVNYMVFYSQFPAIATSGSIIEVKNAIIKDSLRLRIHTSNPGLYYLLIHNYQERYLTLPVQLSKGTTTLQLDSKYWKGGLCTITLFDSSENPIAERTVFNEPPLGASVSMASDSLQYGNRSKVTLNIKATDSYGQPLQASLSLSCVLRNTIDTTRYQTILPYSYFSGYTGSKPTGTWHLYSIHSDLELETILLTKYWTRYRWNELKKDTSNSPPLILAVKGALLYQGKPYKKLAELMLINKESVQVISTDLNGQFYITPDQLTAEPDWKLMLAVNKKDKDGFSIRLYNTNDSLQERLLNGIDYNIRYHAAKPELEGFANAKTLATVTVESKLKNNYYNSKTCNDYVCMYNVLNCPNHPYGTPPQEGAKYKVYTGSNTSNIIYKSCAPAIETNKAVLYELKGRYFTKEFYVSNYSNKDILQSEQLTTLYWNPEVITNAKGEATISFYTNDLEGKIISILQGTTSDGACHKQIEFSVKKN